MLPQQSFHSLQTEASYAYNANCKRKTKTQSQATANPKKQYGIKKVLHAASENLKEMLKERNNYKFNAYISKLSPLEETVYSLWKTAKKQSDLYSKSTYTYNLYNDLYIYNKKR